MKYLFYLYSILLLFSCKEKDIFNTPELVVDIEIIHEYNYVNVLNRLHNAVKYDLDYGDGTKIIADTTLHNLSLGVIINWDGKHYYKKDGNYTITLTGYDKNGKSKTVSKQIVINYVTQKTPIADFSIELLDDGVVKMKNLSKNYSSLEIGTSVGNWGYNTKVENPTFIFDMNGKYTIQLSANGAFFDHKAVEIDIKNTPNRELGYFKGEWLGKQIDVSESFDHQTVTEYMDIAGANRYLLLKNTFYRDTNSIEIINFKVRTDSLKTNEMKYEQIKSKFKLGIQNSDDWAVSFYLPLVSSKKKSIEILEIKEVPQRKIIPEMFDKAFWITYKINADFESYGKIDGILKVRYLIY
ncbi:hypothetical protein VB264_15635 [Arcicella aquatica]|uniref:PKD domain-containing protein n=1 Tax=Arcicella aquatica TaxID=217141 RepID=A0ABU5QQ82_9BACT|nr:hypothetical protein [Arcicella aquatica]MEA5259228.1 hypothetical protein [Arcicella aquatica]